MLPFTQTCAPARLKDHSINDFGDWYQWSSSFQPVLSRLSALITELPSPRLINLYEGKPYDYTYTVEAKLEDQEIHEELLRSAKALYRLRLERPILLTGLIDEEISSTTLHYLFSYYQYCFGLLSGTRDAAMYAPLGDLSETGFPFPLHADLYVQKSLLVVFDNVPLDNSGQTLLISTDSFVRIIQLLRTMPEDTKVYITKLLTLDAAEDRFNDFFYSLYARDAPWSEELSTALAAHQIMVKFQRGEGFLLNDRQWLHGRTTTSGAVHEDRLHRLVFNSTEV